MMCMNKHNIFSPEVIFWKQLSSYNEMKLPYVQIEDHKNPTIMSYSKHALRLSALKKAHAY